jgi:hypothetical protein
MLGTYLRGLHPTTAASIRQAVQEASAARPEIAGALLAALPTEQLAPALRAVLEAYAACSRHDGTATQKGD